MSYTNNVTRFLDAKKIDYITHTYDYDAGIYSAVEVAEALDLPPDQVFKTLVAVSNDPMQKPALVIIPGPDTLNLKQLAKAIGVKKMQMPTRDQAEEMTGLQAGGISALALINRGFVVYLDKRALTFDHIYVSAGERGAEIGVAPKDLIKLTNARPIDL